jgi:hypothetical protein
MYNKNKLRRDLISSNEKVGVYVNAAKDYKKGDEVFIGVLKTKDRDLFDLLVKKIK